MTGIEVTTAFHPIVALALILGAIVFLLAFAYYLTNSEKHSAPLAILTFVLAIGCLATWGLSQERATNDTASDLATHYDVTFTNEIQWRDLIRSGVATVTVRPNGEDHSYPATLVREDDRLTLFTTADKPIEWGTDD